MKNRENEAECHSVTSSDDRFPIVQADSQWNVNQDLKLIIYRFRNFAIRRLSPYAFDTRFSRVPDIKKKKKSLRYVLWYKVIPNKFLLYLTSFILFSLE